MLEIPVADNHLERIALVVCNETTTKETETKQETETETTQETTDESFTAQMNNKTRAALVGGTTDDSYTERNGAFLTHQLCSPFATNCHTSIAEYSEDSILPCQVSAHSDRAV